MTNSTTLTIKQARLFEACEWHQKNDRNGDFLDMWEEYMDGHLPLEIVIEVVTNVFIEIRDEHSAPDDIAQIKEMNDWIEYINGGNEPTVSSSAIIVYEVYDNHYINKESAEYIIENYGNPLETISVREWDGKSEVYVISGDVQIEVDMEKMVKIGEGEIEDLAKYVIEYDYHYTPKLVSGEAVYRKTVEATNRAEAVLLFRKKHGVHVGDIRIHSVNKSEA